MGDTLSLDAASRLRQYILDNGLETAAALIGLNTTTMLRAAVGLPLHNATRQLIESKLNAETKD